MAEGKANLSQRIVKDLETIKGDLASTNKNMLTLTQQVNELKNTVETLSLELAEAKKTGGSSTDASQLKSLQADIAKLVELQHTQGAELNARLADILTSASTNMKPIETKKGKKEEPETQEAAAPEATAAEAATVEEPTAPKKATFKNTEAFFKKTFKDDFASLSELLPEDTMKECRESEVVTKARNGANKKAAEAKWLWDNKFKDKNSDMRKKLEEIYAQHK